MRRSSEKLPDCGGRAQTFDAVIEGSRIQMSSNAGAPPKSPVAIV
jgi:hypothetical protein